MSSTIPPPISEKPQCGSEKTHQEYDLGIHVAGLFLVLAASLFGAGFPVAGKKVKWLRIPPRIFFFCKHFGTGVLIATAFAHLLPTAFLSLNDPCLPSFFTDKYPALAGAIAMASLFSLFAMEMWMHTKLPGAHSHGSATGEEFAGHGHNHSHGHGRNHTYGHGHNINNGLPLRSPLSPVDRPRLVALRESENPYLQRGSGPATHGEITTAPTSAPPNIAEFVISEKESNKLQEKGKVVDFGPIYPDDDEPAWFRNFRVQYEHQRDQMIRVMAGVKPHPHPSVETVPTVGDSDLERQDSAIAFRESEEEESRSYGIVELDPETVDPAVYKKMSMDITLLEGGILFHSIFVGMTVSITTDGFVVLLIAILFHQTFEGLGLGSRIAAVPYPKKSWRPIMLVLAFGLTAPIGQAIGLIANKTYDPNSAFALILVGTFNAISSGLLIYAALVDLLHADFLSPEADRLLTIKKKSLAFVYVLLGAISMAIVGAFA